MLWFSSTERFGRTVRNHADVAQLVEHHLAKVRVAGSSPVIRSEEPGAPSPSISWWVGREVRHRPAKPFTPVRIRYPPRAIGAAGARFPDTEEVTGSIPVSPTEGPGGIRGLRYAGRLSAGVGRRGLSRWESGRAGVAMRPRAPRGVGCPCQPRELGGGALPLARAVRFFEALPAQGGHEGSPRPPRPGARSLRRGGVASAGWASPSRRPSAPGG